MLLRLNCNLQFSFGTKDMMLEQHSKHTLFGLAWLGLGNKSTHFLVILSVVRTSQH